MSSKIQALPLPQGQARVRLAGPLAILSVLVVAAGLAGFLALRQGEPASAPTAAYENSGVVTGTGQGLAELAARHAAYQNSGAITGTGPGLIDVSERFAAYRNSGLVSGTGPALAEIRGVDVIGIKPSSVWPSEAALERTFAGASIASVNFPGVAALERQFGAAPTTLARGRGAMLAERYRVDRIGMGAPSFLSSAALEISNTSPSVPDGCGLVRHGPC